MLSPYDHGMHDKISPLIEVDSRDCAEVLIDWYRHSNAPSTNFFLDDTLSLKSALTEAELNSLVLGSSIPGPLLAIYLALRLPAEIMTRRKWFSRASNALELAKNNDTIITEIEEAFFYKDRSKEITRCLQEIDSYNDDAAIRDCNDPLARKTFSNGLLAPLIEHFCALAKARGAELSQAEGAERLARFVGLQPEVLLGQECLPVAMSAESIATNLASLLSQNDTRLFDQFYQLSIEFFNQSTASSERTFFGNMFYLIRAYTGCCAAEFARRTGFSESTIIAWERSQWNPRLENFISVLNAGNVYDARDRIPLLHSFRKYEIAKREQIISGSNLSANSLGQLIDCEIHLSCECNYSTLGSRLGMSHENIRKIVSGYIPPFERIVSISKALEKFVRPPELPAFDQKLVFSAYRGALQVRNAPYYEQRNLALKDSSELAWGSLLQAERKIADLTRKELAAEVDVGETTIARLERGARSQIQNDLAEVLERRALNFDTKFDRENFIATYNVSELARQRASQQELHKATREISSLRDFLVTQHQPDTWGQLLKAEIFLCQANNNHIANAIGVDPSAINAWTRGKFPQSQAKAQALASALMRLKRHPYAGPFDESAFLAKLDESKQLRLAETNATTKADKRQTPKAG